MHEALNRVLLEEQRANRRFVLVIDEAQNLSESVLESIRLLSNFETPWMKLMHIVLAGQPQLAEQLAKPSMMQLRQRIGQVIRLEPFTPKEVDAYIDCRLEAGGCQDLALFTSGARALIAEYSEGIPRNINNICFNALSLACALDRKRVDRNTVNDVMSDLALVSPRAMIPVLSSREIEGADAPELVIPPGKVHRHMGWNSIAALAVLLIAILSVGLPVSVSDARTIPAKSSVNEGFAPTTAPSDALPSPATTAAIPPPTASGQAGAGNAASLPLAPSTSVLVRSGQTIYGISRATFGRYNNEILTAIRKLNPWLNDMRRVAAGRELLLPSQAPSSGNAQSGADQDDKSDPQRQAQ